MAGVGSLHFCKRIVLTTDTPDTTTSVHARIDDCDHWKARSPGQRPSRDEIHASADDTNDLYASTWTRSATSPYSLDALTG